MSEKPTYEALKEKVKALYNIVGERKKTEDALRKSEERLEILLHSIPVGIIILDSETQEIVDANPKASLMINAPLEHFLGSPSHNFICSGEEEAYSDTDFIESLDNSECELLNADGERIPILKTEIPVQIESRELIIVCFVDIADRKKAEEQLRQHEKLQGVIELAGGVCHELNQPLQAISGYSEILMMRIEEDDPLFDNLMSIKGQIDRMRDITKKLMSITRHETTDYFENKIIDLERVGT
jgi:PAS domain S-box-containing protein